MPMTHDTGMQKVPTDEGKYRARLLYKINETCLGWNHVSIQRNMSLNMSRWWVEEAEVEAGLFQKWYCSRDQDEWKEEGERTTFENWSNWDLVTENNVDSINPQMSKPDQSWLRWTR